MRPGSIQVFAFSAYSTVILESYIQEEWWIWIDSRLLGELYCSNFLEVSLKGEQLGWWSGLSGRVPA
jgi:hypothetical protein